MGCTPTSAYCSNEFCNSGFNKFLWYFNDAVQVCRKDCVCSAA